jgi:hypothetical protein
MQLSIRISKAIRLFQLCFYGCTLAAISIPVFAQRSTADSLKSMSYIQNEFIRVGIDLNLGGSITFLSDVKKGENLINNSDWGRQVQMSFYSGPNPFTPNGKEPAPYWRGLGWNPIQSGDYAGKRSRVLVQKNDGKQLYVKCVPMQWPLDNEPGECTFESWITLKGNTVQVRSRLVNNRQDTTQYAARGQELPAVYTNAPYHRLVSYKGNKPFSKDTVSLIKNHNYPKTPSIKWAYWQATEGWAANLNEADYGLGIWNPDAQSYCGGYYGDDTFSGGSKDASTGYIAPLHTEILDHNITYDYRYVLILGSVDEIRDYVYKHTPKRNLPAFVFKKDRQHWILQNTVDSGWPINNGLHIKLQENGALVSPPLVWNAEDASTLTFTAKYPDEVKTAKVYLKRFGERDFKEENAYLFDVKSSANTTTYQIPLAQSKHYTGTFNGIKILLNTEKPANGGNVVVKGISLKK